MPKYIDCELAKEALTGWDTEPTDEEIEYTLDNIPPADVAEVKHGEWIKTDKGKKCSGCNCLSSLKDDNLESVYCPWCGADMRGEKNGK